jgi:hypothetical protein
MRAKPTYDGHSVKLPNASGEMEDIGSLHRAKSVDLLIAVKAFIYVEENGQISVRLERKRRGSDVGYWVAYKRCGGKLRKAYVSEAYALDPYNLDEAARRLL